MGVATSSRFPGRLVRGLVCLITLHFSVVMNSETGDDSYNQLVPYQPCPFLQPLRESRRHFIMSGRQWEIHQDWTGVGVAGVVWEGAIHLMEFLDSIQERHRVENKRVVELGAGTGIVGMVAATLGADSVWLTDKNTEMTEKNLQANLANLSQSNISIVQYEWGTPPLPQSLTPPFDVVLGADIVYKQDSFHDLIWSLRALSDINTEIILACRHRYSEVPIFLDLLKESGFEYMLLEHKNNVSIHSIRVNKYSKTV